MIGCEMNPPSTLENSFNGYIYDYIIHNYALTQGEIDLTFTTPCTGWNYCPITLGECLSSCLPTDYIDANGDCQSCVTCTNGCMRNSDCDMWYYERCEVWATPYEDGCTAWYEFATPSGNDCVCNTEYIWDANKKQCNGLIFNFIFD